MFASLDLDLACVFWSNKRTLKKYWQSSLEGLWVMKNVLKRKMKKEPHLPQKARPAFWTPETRPTPWKPGRSFLPHQHLNPRGHPTRSEGTHIHSQNFSPKLGQQPTPGPEALRPSKVQPPSGQRTSTQPQSMGSRRPEKKTKPKGRNTHPTKTNPEIST